MNKAEVITLIVTLVITIGVIVELLMSANAHARRIQSNEKGRV